MTVQLDTNSIDSEILNKLDTLVGCEDFIKVTDNLLSDFEYRQLLRSSDKIPDYGLKFLIQSLLRINYDRDIEAAETLFNKSIAQNGYSLTAWTHFPAFLSARGFISKANEYFVKAAENMPGKGTLFNLYSASIDIRDGKAARMAADKFLKMFPTDGERQDWVDVAYEFSELVESQNRKYGVDSELITKILLHAQDKLALLGYQVTNVKHYFDDFRDEVFVVYNLAGTSNDVLPELNGVIADFMVDNDYIDAKLTLAVSVS